MIECRELTKIYGRKDNICKALDNFTVSINSGELVAIIGKSGAGKSTLLHILSGLDRPTSGSVIVNGKNVTNLSDRHQAKFRREEIGIILQNFALVSKYSVIENLMVPLFYSNMNGKSKQELIKSKLNRLDIAPLINKKVKNLSGGEKQRVAIARALISNPSVILADEPTGSLDSKNSDEVLSILKALNSEGITVIIVTHDMDIANMCSRVIEISDGRLI